MLLNHSLENIMTRLARWYNIDIFWENPGSERDTFF